MFSTGETSRLEKLMADSRQQQARLAITEARNNLLTATRELHILLNSTEEFSFPDQIPPVAVVNPTTTGSYPEQKMVDLTGMSAEALLQLERNNLLPDIELEYFQGTNSSPGSDIYRGFTAGVAIPLWFGEQKARIRSAGLERELTQLEKSSRLRAAQAQKERLLQELTLLGTYLDQYRENGRAITEELKKAATLGLSNGDIDFYQYLFSMESAADLENSYLDRLLRYNQAVYEFNYLNP